jgi:integrase
MKNRTTKEPTKFPVRVTGEPTNITIYKEAHNGKSRFMVSYYDAACRRHRRRCTTYEKADALADKLRKEIKTGGWDVLTLRGSEKHAYERSRDWLRRCGKPLDIVVHEYVEAAEILKGLNLVEAARSFVQRQSKKVTFKAAPEVLVELLDDLKQKGKSKVHIRDLRTRLGTFTKQFVCPLPSISTPEIRDYIQKLNGAARYRNHVLDAISTLFTFAKSRSYVDEDHEGTSKITKYEVRRKEVEVFTPAEIATMLALANREVQLALVLTCFAGVRGAELGRLEWGDIRFDLGCIRVKAAHAKTGIRRVPPIPENLRAWLMLHRKESGPVVPYKNVYNQYLKLAVRAQVKWKRNAHRHGFSSYRVALIKNLDQVAIEAGHSKQELLSSYFQVVSEESAKAWFSIFPPKNGHLKPESEPTTDVKPKQK